MFLHVTPDVGPKLPVVKIKNNKPELIIGRVDQNYIVVPEECSAISRFSHISISSEHNTQMYKAYKNVYVENELQPLGVYLPLIHDQLLRLGTYCKGNDSKLSRQVAPLLFLLRKQYRMW